MLNDGDLNAVSGELESIVAMDAVFDQRWVARLDGQRVKPAATKWDQALALIDDIERFRAENGCDRLVMIWCGSTEAYQEPSEVHETLAAFEEGLKADDDNISPSQIYAYAALQSGVPYANGAPNLSVDLACMEELAAERGVPLAGKDFKTGQTLMKTLIAPGLKARMLGLRGWYSTNILGNRDGEVLDDPANFRTKESSKLGVLDTILEPEANPELYGEIDHVVRINYYPPRGDNKEGWDAIDIFGWLGYPMEIKVDFSCRDSILAAPLVLDLVLFLDLAARAGRSGIQEWLSFYFKAPQTACRPRAQPRPVRPATAPAEHPGRPGRLTTIRSPGPGGVPHAPGPGCRPACRPGADLRARSGIWKGSGTAFATAEPHRAKEPSPIQLAVRSQPAARPCQPGVPSPPRWPISARIR